MCVSTTGGTNQGRSGWWRSEQGRQDRGIARRMWRKDATLARLTVIATLISLTVDGTAAGSCSSAKLCCQGRDSGCVIQKESPNAIIESPRDKPCYCDHACLKLADCCDDFKETCGGTCSAILNAQKLWVAMDEIEKKSIIRSFITKNWRAT